jgi:mannose-6-phosphate isomerase-like protein (cupin superfamily)
MALFTLAPGTVARAVAHRSVEEIWYFVCGRGRMWRALDGEEQTLDVRPSMSLTLPIGTRFQFRCDGNEPLVIVATTMPPWPGDGEAYEVTGPWPPTV